MVHVHLEEGVALKGDNKIQTLSWMGKVPDMLPNEDGLKLDRDLYYQEGWLASGNGQGIVGVTFTSCHGVKSIDFPNRTNYNLTGHRNEVVMVRWNEPYQKLVTCDDKGVIFVWIRHEGRWSIELINDRHHKVTDFSWSHDGRMAVICYEDGFVLVGSVGGQRYWSSMLNLEDSHIAAGVWTPDDTKLLLGTSCGQVIVMGSTGAMLSQFELIEGMEISSMAWSCEKFNMEDAEEETDGNERARSRSPIDDCCKAHMLAVSFKYGAVLLMTNYDDVAYKTIHTGLVGLKIEWSNDGDLLACGGFVRQANLDCDNIVKLYCKDGNLKKVIHIPPTQVKPLLALTWGHSDRRLFISAGNCIYVAWVTKNVPTLQMLCRDALKTSLKDESLIQRLPLPLKVQHFVRETFEPTVQGVVPVPQKLRDFVIMPPPNGDRYYCTMIKHENVTYGDYWTLYLEHLGGLFPLLKARKSSKLRPEFVIFDPLTTKTLGQGHEDLSKSSSELSSYESDSNAVDIGCGSPKSQRKNRKRRKLNKLEKDLNNQKLETSDDPSNCLPERQTIVEVASNIWGTKFRIMGCVPYLPRDLGQVVYKSSLLHLQPRQMSLALTDLKDENYCHGNESQSSLCSEEDDEEAASSIQESGLISSRDGLNVVIVPEGSIAQAQFTDPNCASKPHNQVYLLQGASPPDGLNQHNRCDKHVQCDGVEDVPTDISTDECKDSLAIEGLACEATACSACNLAGEEFNQSNLSLSSNDSGYLGAFYKSQGAIPKTHVQNLQPNAPTNERKVRLQSRKEHNLINAMCKGCHRNESGNLCGLCRSTRPVDSSQNKGKIEDLHNMSSDLHRNLKFIDEDSEEEADVKQRTASLLKGSATSVPVEVIETDSVTQMDSIDKQNGEDSSRIISCCDSKLDEIVNCHKKRINSNGFTPINELKNSKNLKNSKFSKQGSVGATEVCAAVGIQLNADVGGGSSTSLPASPVKEDVPKQRSWSRERQLAKSSQSIESSDDEILLTGDELTTSYSYRDLESFQKAQLRQKMRKGRSKSDGERVVARRQFIMHNKAPLWNENNQVYQLDFGGRVTQESAKNFQIEFRGKQVMQFGRIDLNKYTLDYQYPFTGIQAFAVALANVTQRLK